MGPLKQESLGKRYESSRPHIGLCGAKELPAPMRKLTRKHGTSGTPGGQQRSPRVGLGKQEEPPQLNRQVFTAMGRQLKPSMNVKGQRPW